MDLVPNTKKVNKKGN